MADRPKEKRKFQWHGGFSSSGSLDLSMFFEEGDPLTKGQKEKALAYGIAASVKNMLERGFLTPEARFMSSMDIAEKFGQSRQYWEKLLQEGKIPYKETSAGRITTDLWVQGYLDNKEKVDDYVRKVNQAIRNIKSTGKRHDKTACPDCGEDRFEFNTNAGERVNGLCRACSFKINTIIN